MRKDPNLHLLQSRSDVINQERQPIISPEQFIVAINTVIDTVVGRQKARIEERASEIIVDVAKESMNIAGIILDDDYTIMLETATTGLVRYTNQSPMPSNGEKQILGQSFVLALTRFAGFERPMFIDSPFMRLGEEYTTKIADQLVEQNSQVMVLYQPDELKPGMSGSQGARDGIDILKSGAASEWEFTSVNEEQTTVTKVI